MPGGFFLGNFFMIKSQQKAIWCIDKLLQLKIHECVWSVGNEETSLHLFLHCDFAFKCGPNLFVLF